MKKLLLLIFILSSGTVNAAPLMKIDEVNRLYTNSAMISRSCNSFEENTYEQLCIAAGVAYIKNNTLASAEDHARFVTSLCEIETPALFGEKFDKDLEIFERSRCYSSYRLDVFLKEDKNTGLLWGFNDVRGYDELTKNEQLELAKLRLKTIREVISNL